MNLPSQETIALTAFLVGAVSAISLPLGALTARFWVPEDRTISALMAFGGGALLAALSVDLVAPAIGHGHFYQLAFGSILGGLLFLLLNEAVNDYGGFIRKVSTSVYHLRHKRHRQFRDILSHVDDLDLFGEIEDRDFRAIAAFIEVRRLPANTLVFDAGDRCEGLFILASGKPVSLVDPKQDMRVVRQVRQWETFAKLSFLTGAPHDTRALTTAASEIWLLPRDKFLTLLVSSPRLAQAVHSWLRDPATFGYLVERHGMHAERAEAWADQATQDLVRHATVPPALDVDHRAAEFLVLLAEGRATPLFNDLPDNELQELSKFIVYKRSQRGRPCFTKAISPTAFSSFTGERSRF